MTGASHDGSHSSSWVCTILTQVALCVAMYVAFHMAAPLKYNQEYKSGAVVSDGGARDFIFLSVCGGRMPREQQTHLLELMDRVAKAYKVQFVVNVSELGEDDPLIENFSDCLHLLHLHIDDIDSNTMRIAVGIHPLIACEEAENETVTRKVYQSLDQIFLRYQVASYFINSAGKVIFKSTLRQRGMDVM
ncbi:hypothetical protein ACLOJK_002594 [Asimina triloba]